jgi:hypothetical protein
LDESVVVDTALLAPILNKWMHRYKDKNSTCRLCGQTGSHSPECLLGQHAKAILNQDPVVLAEARVQANINASRYGIKIKWDGPPPSQFHKQ